MTKTEPPRELVRELGSLGMHLRGYFVSVQGSLAMFAIHRWGSEEQQP
jgi:hypothetical protein